MATKNSNYEDLMLRLSKHVVGINLILDIVDVNSFPGGSRLENTIAGELINLRARINQIPAAKVVYDKGADPRYVSTRYPDTLRATSSPLKNAQPGSKKASGPAPTKSQHSKGVQTNKNPAKAAPPAPKQLSPIQLGRNILMQTGETENFQLSTDNHFYCLLCECSMHPNNMMDHINGRGHSRFFTDVSSSDDEEEDGYSADNGYDDGNYDPIVAMMDEMDDSSYERSVELMWDIVYATDDTIEHIQQNGKWFFCRLCNKTLNGPYPVVDHVRGSLHQAD